MMNDAPDGENLLGDNGYGDMQDMNGEQPPGVPGGDDYSYDPNYGGPMGGWGPPRGPGPFPPMRGGGPGFRGGFSGGPGGRPPWGPPDGPPRFMPPRGPPMRGGFRPGFRGPPPFPNGGPRFNGPYDNSNWGGPPPHGNMGGGGGGGWNERPDGPAPEEAPVNPLSSLLPPGVDFNTANVWIETKTPEGKCYFYNAKTRETAWEKPQNAHFIQQEELEKVIHQVAQPSQKDGPPGEGKDDGMAMGNGDFGGYGGYQSQQYPGMQPQWGMGPPPGMMGMPPPGGMGMPPPVVAAAVAPPGYSAAALGIDESELVKKLDPEIVAKANEWTEHQSPNGLPYYYNTRTSDSVWDKPPALRDFEAAKMAAIHAMKMMKESGDTDPFLSMKTDHSAEPTEKTKAEPVKMETSSDKAAAEEAKPAQEETKKADKSRPVSSVPVPGTPWCVVWTGDGRMFFYNPSTRSSVWERPNELLNRGEVEKIIAGGPPDKDEVRQPAANTNASDEDEEEDEDEEDEEPTNKKPRLDADVKSAENTGEDKPKTIDIGMQSAIEAESRAAKEREQVPLETRMQQFREMLAEKEVSAFSTWEKELHKIVFDQRYLLLTSKERKAVFEKYVKERAEDERREKKLKMKQKRDDFRTLLEESSLHTKSSFSEFSSKHQKDERYKGIEKMRERESLFNEYIQELRRKEKEDNKAKREKIFFLLKRRVERKYVLFLLSPSEKARKDFLDLLKECTQIDRHSHWADVKRLLDTDARYEAVGSSSLREELFREHVHKLKEERGKDESRREKKSKKKDKKKDRREYDRDEEDEDRKAAKSRKSGGSSSGGGGGGGGGAAEDEENEDGEVSEEREKKLRAEASLRQRELEVQKELEGPMRDRDKEREAYKRDVAVQHFCALLSDLVRGIDLTWHEAKKQLRKDRRWDLAKSLEKEEKEKLYELHIETLTQRKKERFRELLDEVASSDLGITWKEVKRSIKDDPRFTKFALSERKAEREFKDYVRDRINNAKAEFKDLLRETKMITHKCRQSISDNAQHLKDILEVLSNDKRYLVLDRMPEERDAILKDYIEELAAKGPPPPPTASEPTRRK
ncbi:unnamed protein product [Notodromas monacha]|uniref:Transcription elongation regulator 1 n=1 Tax=Notodromas monacha TaxID=399045 RepID=A0A7R9GG98_9CRUS|nr:unnamed protein product [Notodromas monacha]CAG0921483.1 unnamed protein product [Notodromas monacha]